MMGNVNQITPDGSLMYDQSGMHSFTDPYTGHTYDIPTFTATQTLSPEQEAIQADLRAAQGNLAGIANDRSQFLSEYLRRGVNTSDLPGLVGSAGLNANFSSDLGENYNQVFSRDIGGGYDTNFNRNIGGGYDTNFNRNIGGGYNTRFNQTLGRNFNEVFDGNIGGSFTDRLGSDYTTGVDLATTYSGADDFSADRQRFEDALWSRGTDDRARAEEALRTRLLNSGIREGSAAWSSEMERMNRQNEDARLATYLSAGQEQARMVELARQAAIFGNESTLAQAQFGNNALTNQFQLQNQASLAQAQFGSQQQQLQNQAAHTNASFLRENQLMQNNAALNQAQFGSQQQQLQNAAAMGQAQFGSQQQQLQNAAAMGQAQFGHQAQLAQNNAALNQAQFGSQQQQLANQALLSDAQFQNAARSQGMQEAYASRAQPLNEVIGLMSGSQIQQPNFVNAGMPTIPTTDNAGLINNHYNQQLAQWQANQGVMGGVMAGVGSLIGLSDDDAKKDKKRLGNVDDEMGLWEFRYKGEPKSQPKHIGLMASEVEKVKPGAVKRGKDGLRRVDYGRALGLMGAG